MTLQLKNWSVQKKLALLIGSFLVSFIAFVIVAYLTLAAVKVNGPYYAQIAQGRSICEIACGIRWKYSISGNLGGPNTGRLRNIL